MELPCATTMTVLPHCKSTLISSHTGSVRSRQSCKGDFKGHDSVEATRLEALRGGDDVPRDVGVLALAHYASIQ
jgi:hypothetical protein